MMTSIIYAETQRCSFYTVATSVKQVLCGFKILRAAVFNLRTVSLVFLSARNH